MSDDSELMSDHSDRLDYLEVRVGELEGRSPEMVSELGLLIHGLLADIFDALEGAEMPLPDDVNERLDRLYQVVHLMM
jgi:hypothetical protein